MATGTEQRREEAPEEFLEYRALSSSAVVSVIFALAAFFSIFAAETSIDAWLVLAPLPVAGLVLGAYAWQSIHRKPDQMTGKPLAICGTLLSLGIFLGGLGRALYVYANECPPEYQRVSFTQMKPDDLEEARHVLVPPDIVQLAGQDVFIKGYIWPGSQRHGLDSFLLVRDNNECCFGDLSKVKYHDQIQVYLQGDRRTSYSARIFRVGGKLQINPAALAAPPGSPQPVFTLMATYIK